MLEFKKLTLEDIPKIKGYFAYSKTGTCDDTVGGTFMWRDVFQTEYACFGENLILKAKYFDSSTVFSYPLGKDAESCLDGIYSYCRQNGCECKFVFVAEENVKKLQNKFVADALPEYDWFDYVYNISDIATFNGRKYNGQRNHKNAFLKQNPCGRFEKITDENVRDAIEFYKTSELYRRQGDRLFEEEKIKTVEVLENLDLYGFEGGILYGNEGVCGFSAGEVKDGILHVHVEKADSKKRGAYQTTVSEFARYISSVYGDEVKLVNRQEDMGIEGLRISKLSYHPCTTLNKYTVTVK